jgi:hypothetical protein
MLIFVNTFVPIPFSIHPEFYSCSLITLKYFVLGGELHSKILNTRNIHETGHAYNTINQTMKVLNNARKGHKLNTLERYHIYDLTKKALQMNDTFSDLNNTIFDILTKYTQ